VDSFSTGSGNILQEVEIFRKWKSSSGSGNPLDAEVDQNEEVSTIAPLPLGNCHCPLCPQCVQQQTVAVPQQQGSTSATSQSSQTAGSTPVDAGPPVSGPGPSVRHGCKLSACSHCSLGGRYSSRSSVPTVLRMQVCQPRWYRSSSNCSQISQMMVAPSWTRISPRLAT